MLSISFWLSDLPREARQDLMHKYVRPGDANRKTALVSVDVHYKEFDHRLMHNMVRQSGFSAAEFYGATKHTARRASVPFVVPAGTKSLEAFRALADNDYGLICSPQPAPRTLKKRA